MAQIIKTEEFEQNGSIYIREIYDKGHIVEYPKPQEIIEPIEQSTPEPTQLDRIEQAINTSNDELRQEGADALVLELIERGIL